MKFNSLILIDVWDEEWRKKHDTDGSRVFIAKLLDFVEMFSFENVILSLGFDNTGKASSLPRSGREREGGITHQDVLDVYPDAICVQTLDDVKSICPENSNVLVGGTAWNLCLHEKPISFVSLHDAGYRVYSSKEICDTSMYSIAIVEDDYFKNDKLIKWQQKYGMWRILGNPKKENLKI